MKKNWEVKKLGEVCSLITDGKHGDCENQENSGYYFLSAKDLKNNTLQYEGARQITKKDFEETHRRTDLKPGDVLITNSGTIGRMAIAPNDERTYKTTFQKSVAIIKPIYSIINNVFCCYHLQADLSKLVNVSAGTAQKNLLIGDLKKHLVKIPPLPEQQRLVALLDEVFAAIATAKENADRNLQNARELFEVVLQNEFEKVVNVSEVKKLGEACSFSQGIQVDVKNQNEQKKDNQVRFLRIIDFTQGNEPPRYIDNPGEKYIIKSDDVSLVRYGATTGFVCSGLEGALANNLFRVIPESNKISKEFLYWFLRSPVFQNEIAPSINGAAMPAISFGLINDIKFPILLLAEQRAIVGRLEALSAETKKLEAIYQQKLTNLEELKKSVLQKAFKGEL